jgi:bifunctional UDP-N-acetylglucosamine pyrophosphorylase / glucosamine-1-phosphate N-acetyltransferase
MTAPVVVILAAGQGTRMRSRVPKLLHEICGRAMIGWPIAAARGVEAASIVVVQAPDRPLDEFLDEDIVTVVQAQALGTADAVKAAAEYLDTAAPVVVLNGDAPLLTAATVHALALQQEQSGAGATLLTAELADPSGYGRVVRAADGTVEQVVETKKPEDATPEQLLIKEINSGIYAFDGPALADALTRVGNDNAQGEYYLPDVLAIMRADGRTVSAVRLADADELLGVNDRAQLADVQRVAQARIQRQHMLAGATIVSPETTVIEVGVTLGQDVVIEPGSYLRGSTSVADGAVIGPHSVLIDTRVGEASKVVQSHVVGATIHASVSVGPFAYLRPGALLRDKSKAGTFVEIKNTDVGEGSKVPHLSYIGDADIGPGTNLGAATITANYDGFNKHRTKIGANVHTGVDTTFVAPVEIGDDADTGAGSVITKDVPPGALGIARARQSNLERYAERKQARQPTVPGGE